MPKNQLFRILPDIDMINIILDTFGLTSLDDTKPITKYTIHDNNTVNKLNKLKDTLESHYLPCKAMYIRDICEKRCIVILRQFIKVHGFTLFSRERHIQGKKVIVYRIIKDDKTSLPKQTMKPDTITICFK